MIKSLSFSVKKFSQTVCPSLPQILGERGNPDVPPPAYPRLRSFPLRFVTALPQVFFAGFVLGGRY